MAKKQHEQQLYQLAVCYTTLTRILTTCNVYLVYINYDSVYDPHSPPLLSIHNMAA